MACQVAIVCVCGGRGGGALGSVGTSIVKDDTIAPMRKHMVGR